jgi:hypothetical protein
MTRGQAPNDHGDCPLLFFAVRSEYELALAVRSES